MQLNKGSIAKGDGAEAEPLLHGSFHIIRYEKRAHCLILAEQAVKVKELMKIFKVSYKIIYNWFNRWDCEGIIGLYNKPGIGAKPTFNDSQISQIIEWTKQEPRQLKHVVQKIKESWGIEISTLINSKNTQNYEYEERIGCGEMFSENQKREEYKEKQAQSSPGESSPGRLCTFRRT